MAVQRSLLIGTSFVDAFMVISGPRRVDQLISFPKRLAVLRPIDQLGIQILTVIQCTSFTSHFVLSSLNVTESTSCGWVRYTLHM